MGPLAQSQVLGQRQLLFCVSKGDIKMIVWMSRWLLHAYCGSASATM